MAVVPIPVALPATRRSQRNFFQIDRNRPVEIYVLTKAGGDTTYDLLTGLHSVKEVIVLDSDGAVISGATASVSVSSDIATIALAVLGAGTLVVVIVAGNRATK